ncbi:MAG TPA: hypothetical protein PLL80_01490 [Candidatus Pacearchaeota archaeon]|nr:hypothetical protein [Candidatus Pacearchaeota archaeon]
MRKLSIFLLSILLTCFFLAGKALAICPLCTIAVGAGVGFSRWLGIDDTITGLWIGGLIVSLITWTDDWLEKKKVHFKGRTFLIVIAYYALVVVPLYYSGIIGNPLNTLCFCHLDKLLFGDDTITGLWIGGLLVSLIIWTETWFSKKNISFKGRTFLVIVVYYALVIIPLYYLRIMGNPLNTLCFCHLDKLLFGIIAGSIAFWCGASWHYYLKDKNNGHVYFPFQKVLMPISPLIILSIIFYFLTK